jgi:transcriptional regulator with GAF, ATPase, and Fis domain
MLRIPPRHEVSSLAEAVNAVVPCVACGFARATDEGHVSVIYVSPHGLGEYVVAKANVADVLSPTADGALDADLSTLNASGAIESQLFYGQAQAVYSIRVPGMELPARFWIGRADQTPLTIGQRDTLELLGERIAGVLTAKPSAEETERLLQRLEQAAALLPAMLRVLDVREVFDRLSAISRAALPHDMLTLGVFDSEMSTVTMFARSGKGSDLGRVFPQPYPRSVTEAWNFDIIDDRLKYPFEQDRPPTKLGMRSSLRVPFRFDGRVIGGLGFHASEVAKYSHNDVIVARRLGDHVALGLSHHRLAEQLAEQARSHEELRARTTNLELLDDLLANLTESGSLKDVFERISAIARKVLPHDALGFPVYLPDRRHARRYASTGLGVVEVPELLEIPEAFTIPEWEYDLIDDVTLHVESYNRLVAGMGFRSALRVPVRLDGQVAGMLAFLATQPSSFRPADILVARRIADRVAIALARDREVEASRRADDATERASRLEARVRALTDELDSRTGYRRVVGESRQWREVLTQAAQVAATETTVLLLGESGTGKEVVARFLHRGSARHGGPFVALNCAALPEQLLEAELFGYERGAYTGATQSKPGQLEQAAGGTLFLDEVGEMSPSAQAKFLRVLQEREFQRLGGTRVLRSDARVVAATNRDLPRAIANGQFREDLYYRLNVFAIRLPPLRDRKDDILPLSEAFLTEIGRGLGRPPGGISREARQLLVEYHWPGNVRELRNILERAAILCDGGLIAAEHLAITLSKAVPPAPPPPKSMPKPEVAAAASAGPPRPTSAGDLQSMERAMIEQALQTARFNKSKAAKVLGLTRHQLYIRMRKYGFE